MTSTSQIPGYGCTGFKIRAIRFHILAVLTFLLVQILPAQGHLSLIAPVREPALWLHAINFNLAQADSLQWSLNSLNLNEEVHESPVQTEIPGPLFLDFSAASAAGGNEDSLPPPRVHSLLPTNISFMEKALWGQEGFMRTSGIVPQLTPEERAKELGVRRTMLSLHQIGGFTSLGLMLVTAYFGQRVIDDTRSRSLRNDHQTFVAATIATYSATGVLAILSPPPLIRRDEVSTTTIHKTLAWVHAIGMIVTPILGSMIGRRTDAQKAHIHQIAGYFTTATYAASMITVTF